MDSKNADLLGSALMKDNKKVTNIYDVKKAKTLTKELSSVILILDSTLTKLKDYDRYKPVIDCLRAMKSTKHLMEIHRNKWQRVLDEN